MKDVLRPRKAGLKEVTTESSNEITETRKKPKSAAQKQREYRERMKQQNPEKFARVLEEQKKRSAVNRVAHSLLSEDDEKKVHAKALNRERVRRYREKNVAKVTSELKKQEPRTRADKEKLEMKREKDRLRKQAERDSWSKQKRTAENKKARERRMRKKELSRKQNSVGTNTEKIHQELEINEMSNITGGSRRQALYRVRKALPKHPEKRQLTLSDLLNGEKKKEEPSPADHLLKLVMQTKLGKQEIMKKVLSEQDRNLKLTYIKYFNLSRQLAHWHKQHWMLKKARSHKKRRAVEQFIIKNSQPVGGKKSLCRGIPKRVLHRNVTDLYASFLKDCVPITCSLSFFCKVRRTMKYCVSAAKLPYNQTLCEQCENVRLKLKALKKVNVQLPEDVHQYLDMFSCQKEGRFFNKECVGGKCIKCPQLEVMEEDSKKNVNVTQWGNEEIDGKKKKCLIDFNKTAGELVGELKLSLPNFRRHMFEARWQYHQFLQIKANLKDGTLLMVMDFGENYRCSHQDEVQAAYWSYEQATIHPIVTYYNCPDCQSLVTESIVIISNDMQHDSFAVENFFQKALQHLQNKITIASIIQFTDGCGVQYKSRVPFAKIASKRGLHLERHYFGSGHGKNPSDGESAVVKTKASRAVKCRHVIIQSAKDLYTMCAQSLTKHDKLEDAGCCNHYRRTFFYVPSSEICRDAIEAKPVKGTRKVHCVKAAGDGVGIFTRNLTCLCDGCTTGIGECHQPYDRDGWKYHQILKDSEPSQNTSVDTSLSEIMSNSMLEQVEQDLGCNAEDLQLSMNGLYEMSNNEDHIDKNAESKTLPAPGEYVKCLVRNENGLGGTSFNGVVLSIDEELLEVNVSFMRAERKGYIFPTQEDTSWVKQSDIVCILPFPQIKPDRRFHFE